jgi:single-stranded-DNA-specific exonuclease
LIKEWIISPPWDRKDAAALRWGVSPLIAQILHNRGIDFDDDPAHFLRPQISKLFPPETLPGARDAARTIAATVQAKKKIVIYGDYDVDGITGTACLWHVLSAASANVSFYIPHRLDEGYGMNEAAVQGLLEDGADLIVSVDCGITAVACAKQVRAAGKTLIITDHHQPGDELPAHTQIVHPSCLGDSPNQDLCGAGVAFKLAWAVAQEICGREKVSDTFRGILHHNLAFAALGTIADVVPLTGENRAITRFGLGLLPNTPIVGLRVLMDSAGLTSGKIDAFDVGFKIAPRLNAAGRMGHARLAVDLLTHADESRSREIALYLEEQNRSRQSTERKITKQAIERVRELGMNQDSCRAIVLSNDSWHAGVIGIVASRLVNEFQRPTIIISCSGDVGQGSGRSIRNFDINWALGRCSEHLAQFGGHPMAAGLRIDPNKIPAFVEAFVSVANNAITGADLRLKLRIDAEVELSVLNMSTAEALVGMGPFGSGNPSPRLATGWVDLASEPRCVGKTQKHVQATFSDGGSILKAIAFGQADKIDLLKKHRRCRVAFKPIINDFNGRRTVEMEVLDLLFP